jgi:hypothetical protein
MGVGIGVGTGVGAAVGALVGLGVRVGVGVGSGVGVVLGDGGGVPVFEVQVSVGAKSAPHDRPKGVQKPV